MRAAFGFLVMVLVMAAVLMLAKKQAQQALPAVKPAASAASAVSAPKAVGQEVQGLIEQGAKRNEDSASEAQP